MKAPNLHLNLLREEERQSSSPVRLRVMLPALAMLACVGCLVWWGTLFGQQLVLKAQIAALQKEIDGRKAQHDAILSQMGSARNYQAELDQLTMYANGRRRYGLLFAKLAEVVPEGVQLLSLEIPRPPEQNLLPPHPPGAKVQPLLGPTGTVENVSLRILGRTEKETPVMALMTSLEMPDFTNVLTTVKGEGAERMSPRIHSFRQESGEAGKARLLAFDIEYRCRERRFEK